MIRHEPVLAALADPTRRRLLEELRRRPRTVGELTVRVPISQPAVSQHLRVLREARLVEQRREGARRIYSVDRMGLEALRAYVESFWHDILEAFADAESEHPKGEERRDPSE